MKHTDLFIFINSLYGNLIYIFITYTMYMIYIYIFFYEADAKAHGNLLNKGKQHTNLYT